MCKSIQDRLNTLKSLLALVAEKYNFDFQHPEIQKISQEIDELIVFVMKKQL